MSPVAQGLAFHERHHVEDGPVDLAGVEQRQDVGMLQVGGGGDFLEKPLRSDDGGQLRPHHLERDPALVAQVMGQVDGGHATRAELTLDAVAVGQRRVVDQGIGRQPINSTAGSASPPPLNRTDGG
ncbi:MAG TPA: hypothetical protein VGA78_09810 [Gemmatimonadales bacterium]